MQTPTVQYSPRNIEFKYLYSSTRFACSTRNNILTKKLHKSRGRWRGCYTLTQINLDWNNVKTEKTGPSLNEGIVALQSTPPPQKKCIFHLLLFILQLIIYMWVNEFQYKECVSHSWKQTNTKQELKELSKRKNQGQMFKKEGRGGGRVDGRREKTNFGRKIGVEARRR